MAWGTAELDRGVGFIGEESSGHGPVLGRGKVV
jgi:hypothetical protein